MGELLAIGGLHVPSAQVGPLEKAIRAHCDALGFPRTEQFKWSPGKSERFQKENLNDEKRFDFYNHLLKLAAQHGATATVVISDRTKGKARRTSKTHEDDILALFLERIERCFLDSKTDGLLIVATPSGGSKEHNSFVAETLAVIRDGTEYTALNSLALGIVLAPSRQMRLLQLADIICSCTVARVGGENNFSPRAFDIVRPLFRKSGFRIGGIGLKIHPDFNYANLYHWLLGDRVWMKGMNGCKLPQPGFPYSENAGEAAHQLKDAS
jgi:hypothetical protein